MLTEPRRSCLVDGWIDDNMAFVATWGVSLAEIAVPTADQLRDSQAGLEGEYQQTSTNARWAPLGSNRRLTD